MNGSVAIETSGQLSCIPGTENYMLRPGNTNCGGCGMSSSFSMLHRVLAEAGEKSSVVIPACCAIVAAGGFPTTSFGVPCVAATFAAAPAFAAGLAAVRDINRADGQVVCWAGAAPTTSALRRSRRWPSATTA